jgi:pimeloyl-ACP methyl ester carboxylesterase
MTRVDDEVTTAARIAVDDPAAYERGRALPATRYVDLDGVTLRVHDAGAGPVILLVNGFLANADLWRGVVPPLVAAGFRCVAPDWPLGGHPVPVPGADLSVEGLADLLERLLTRLDLTDVTVVANDSGGVGVQALMVRADPRVARVVLTPVDCYAHYPPPVLAALPVLARSAVGTRLAVEALRSARVRRLPVAFGAATHRPVPARVLDGYLMPSRDSAAIRSDVRRFLRTVAPRHTLAVARGFGSVRIPVRVVWGSDDRMFPVRLARRLVADIAGAELTVVDRAAAWLPEDRPDVLADVIRGFVR